MMQVIHDADDAEKQVIQMIQMYQFTQHILEHGVSLMGKISKMCFCEKNSNCFDDH